MPSEQYFCKLGGQAAILGVLVLFTATLLHPAEAHPEDAPAAFAEYAADQYWVVTHLAQLFGVVLINAGLISLSWRLREGRAGVWATLGALGAVASVAVAAALQAVDGIALKIMVDRWMSAPPDSKSLFFESAFAVRQIEIGLASMVSLLFGLTVVLLGVALLLSLEGPTWLGLLGMLGGFTTMAAGIVQAYTGFSDAAMAVSMPSSLVLLLWVFLAGRYLLRKIVT